MVCLCQQQQVLRADAPVKQPVPCLLSAVLRGIHIRLHVQLHHVQHIAAKRLFPRQPPQKVLCQRHARRFVPVGVDHAVLLLHGHRLAHVVQQRRQHQPRRVFRLVPELSRLVHNQHRVRPCVPLRVAIRPLLHADERRDLLQPGFELSHLPQRFKASGWPPASRQRLLHFAHHALPRQPAKVERPAERHRFRRNRKLQPRRELRRPDGSQRVAPKGSLVHMPNHPLLDVRLPAESVDQRSGQRVPHHRVHREVAPPRRFLHAHKGVDVRVLALSAAASGQRDVQRIPAQRKHAEARAHLLPRSDLAQHPPHRVRRHPVDFDVHILAFPSHHAVEDETSDKVDAPARFLSHPRNPPRHRQISFHAAPLFTRILMSTY